MVTFSTRGVAAALALPAASENSPAARLTLMGVVLLGVGVRVAV